MTPQQTLGQVKKLTETFVGLSLSNEQYFPATAGTPGSAFEITIGNSGGLAVALKNLPYRDIYAELEKARCFNIKMLDGALISLRYRFIAGSITEHSLSYFPSPDLEQFQNQPELYLDDEIYADVVARNIVPFPIRFDFSSDVAKFVDVHHPYSHLTLGQYKNCRIPVCSPIGPFSFGGFILRNFYNTAFRKYSDKLPVSSLSFPETISAAERNVLHIACGAARTAASATENTGATRRGSRAR